MRDYPVVMGILVISSLLFLLGNILSDLCVALVDPRVKFGSGEAALSLVPQTRKQWQRFRSIKRGYYSLLAFCWRCSSRRYSPSCWVNNRALIVRYDGSITSRRTADFAGDDLRPRL